MNKAKELLKELQNLDMDIQSRIDEINELEAGPRLRLKAANLGRLTTSMLNSLP